METGGVIGGAIPPGWIEDLINLPSNERNGGVANPIGSPSITVHQC